MKSDALQMAKQAVGKAAADLIQDGMLVGLGTGSTATFFIENLILRCRQTGLKIQAVASSQRSHQQALNGGIPLLDPDQITSLDLTVDGADEIDHHKRMIKGGGGALLKEKILASISKEMIVIVDESKVVDQLGAFPLPLEIVPFAYQAILSKIRDLGYDGFLRKTAESKLYVTDNNNYLIDIHFFNQRCLPEKDQATLSAIPGVVETGFFLKMAGRVLVGHSDGIVKTLS